MRKRLAISYHHDYLALGCFSVFPQIMVMSACAWIASVQAVKFGVRGERTQEGTWFSWSLRLFSHFRPHFHDSWHDSCAVLGLDPSVDDTGETGKHWGLWPPHMSQGCLPEMVSLTTAGRSQVGMAPPASLVLRRGSSSSHSVAEVKGPWTFLEHLSSEHRQCALQKIQLTMPDFSRWGKQNNNLIWVWKFPSFCH